MKKLILIAICIYTVNSQICSTPNTTCKRIQDCPALRILLKPPITDENRSILRKAQCGQPTALTVCCPEPLAVTTPVSHPVCNTLEGNKGVCKSIRSCPHMLAKLQTKLPDNISYVRSSICQGREEFSVCCGPDPDLPETPGLCAPSELPVTPDTECCGKDSSSSSKLLEGDEAKVNQFPWTALIEYKAKSQTRFLCVGALVSSRFVLTSGHCVAGPITQQYAPRNVRLGEYDTRSNPDCVGPEAGGKECNENFVMIPIELIITHKDYTPGNTRKMNNDIAMLKLQRLAPYTEFIRPICLPSSDYDTTLTQDSTLIMPGWNILDNDIATLVKSYANVPFIPLKNCQALYTPRNVTLWEGHICAGDVCKVGLNGPLTYVNGQHHELVGFVSFGPPPCYIEGLPVVYTNVRHYLPWIRETMTFKT